MTNTIREAIRVLSRAGWTKDAFTDASGRHCIQGALYEVYVVIETQFPERTGGVGVSRFNDHPDTTVDDVVQVMEKAAVRKDERV